MSKFSFATDEESRDYCEEILETMVDLFDISKEEALGRINRTWDGLEILGDDLIYHEELDYWANNIYYGNASFWWLNPPDLKPLPYP